jgi:hypothetical protein
MADLLPNGLRNGRTSHMQYPPALITLDYIDFVNLLVALPTRLWPMPSRYTLLHGHAVQQSIAIEVAR